MPDDLTDPDDALADMIADRIVERAMEAPGPVRLVALRMAGLIPEDCPLSQSTVATFLGTTRWQVRRLEARGLSKLKTRATTTTPTPPQPQP